MEASHEGHSDCVKELLEKGALAKIHFGALHMRGTDVTRSDTP